MKDDYLWDRSGPPDPEIERLERALAPLRYRHRAEVVTPSRPLARAWLAAAAAVLVATAVVWQVNGPAPVDTNWQVASVAGTARMGGENAAVNMALRAGQTLRTGRGSELRLQSEEMGKISLGADSQLRATSTKQMALSRGAMYAMIWARPGQFTVDTPSARALDLGCEYTINVDSAGNGLLKVTMGWVAFLHAGREAFIPAGAACITRKRTGPGIPYFEDAPEALRVALTRFENGEAGALGAVLAAARPRDGLTLWHLLSRVRSQDRGAVFDRFAQLVTLPPEVTRESALRLEAQTMDLCWNALNLENTEWWRGWERKWGE